MMADLIYPVFAREPNGRAMADLRSHLHTIQVISAELSNGIDLAANCIHAARVARAEFDMLTKDAHLGELIQGSDPTGQSKSMLNVVANRAADLMEGGRRAQTLVNEFAATAVEAIATLKIALQVRCAPRNAEDPSEMIELRQHADEIVSNCTGWVRLGGAMAHLLHHECTQLGQRLAEHVHCEMLATQALVKAQRGTGLDR